MNEKWLLLHGALGSKDQMEPLKHVLSSDFDVISMSVIGHGERESTEETFSIPLFAADVALFLKEKDINKVNIFGYSMGGYLALYMACHYPDKVNKVITFGTKFDWNLSFAKRENELINPSVIEKKVPHFAKILEYRHTGSDWREVLRKSSEILIGLGTKPELDRDCFKKIKQEVLILVGDKDHLVTVEESERVSKQLSNSSCHVIVDCKHEIETCDLKKFVKYFS